jgi:hypothetical protein
MRGTGPAAAAADVGGVPSRETSKARTFLARVGLGLVELTELAWLCSLGRATEPGRGIPPLVITASGDPRITIYDTWRDEKRVI